MGDIAPTDIKEALAQKGAKDLPWSSSGDYYVTGGGEELSSAQKKLLSRLMGHGLVSRSKFSGDPTQYIACDTIAERIPQIHEERQRRNSGLVANECKANARRDGFDSISAWVVGKVPYHLIGDEVCISDTEANKSPNKQMLNALCLTSDDFTRCGGKSQFEGMRYLATGDLAKQFIEKGKSDQASVSTGDLVTGVFQNRAGSSTNIALSEALQANNVVRFSPRGNVRE